jgi:hypothetical protein
MRRYVLYFAVALLAFSVGSFVAIEFRQTPNEKIAVIEQNEMRTENDAKNNTGIGFGTGYAIRRLNEPAYVRELHKPTCKNRKLLPVWNELRKDEEFRELEKDFYMNADCSKMLDVEKMDLNGDGQNEFILWGNNGNLCGATGSCSLWIYEKENGKYKLLLRSGGYNAETKWFEIKNRKTKGYRNLLIKGHYSASETTHSLYKFNGNRYVENKCWFEIYHINEEKPSTMTCKEYSEETERQLRESQTAAGNH